MRQPKLLCADLGVSSSGRLARVLRSGLAHTGCVGRGRRLQRRTADIQTVEGLACVLRTVGGEAWGRAAYSPRVLRPVCMSKG